VLQVQLVLVVQEQELVHQLGEAQEDLGQWVVGHQLLPQQHLLQRLEQLAQVVQAL